MRRTATLLTAGAATCAIAGLLKRQSALADERVRPYLTPAPPVREHYGDPADPPLTLAVLGDSSAQGVGVNDFDDTLGGWLGARLAAGGRYVRVVTAAVDGSRAEHLDAQVTQVLAAGPQLAVVSTGVNDVRNRSNPRRAARDLGSAVHRLRAAGAVVVVGTTPYLGILTQVDQPLRTIGHSLSRLLEREQVRAVVAAGGRPVLFGRLLSPVFRADRGLFARDGFHPSQRGYALLGEHVLPALLAEAADVGLPGVPSGS